MAAELELGTLVIVVLKARNLIDKHSFYKQDVFAQVSLNGVSQRTPVDVKGGQHPVWDAEIRIPIMKDAGEKYRKLEVGCYAKEHKLDDLLGSGKVDISETLQTGEFDDWVPLDISGVGRGDIYLEMTFYAHGPAKTPAATAINRRPSKLKPSERLWRPVPPNTPPRTSPRTSPSPSPGPQSTPRQDYVPSRTGKYLVPPAPSPPSSRGTSPQRDQPLPNPPSESAWTRPKLPGALTPGSGDRRQSPFPDARLGTLTPPEPSGLSPQHRDAPLPSVPIEQPAGYPMIPETLMPGAYRTSPPRSPRPQSLTPPQSRSSPQPFAPSDLPAALRPGGRPSTPLSRSPTPDYTTPAKYSPPLPPRPSNAGYFSMPVPTPYPPLSQQWRTSEHASTLSFPVPQTAVPNPLANEYSVPRFELPAAQMSYPGDDRQSDLPDPYHLTRYTTPHPLPESPPRGRQSLDPAVEMRRKELLRVEEEAAKRKKQEEEDLEIARQLDRELNLGAEG